MKNIRIFSAIALVASLVACNRPVDNAYSRHHFQVEMKSSVESVVLNEKDKDAEAINIKWTGAKDYGDEYITTYKYKVEAIGSAGDAISEFEDEGYFERSYSNGELQDLLTGHFAMPTSTWCQMRFTITATFDGPMIIIPDESSVTVAVKTYGAKQFAADKVFIGGTAAGPEPFEITGNNGIYIWNGPLTTGTLQFPVVYGDENNVIIPADGKTQPVTGEAQAATVVEAPSTVGWTIASAEAYRVTVNFNTKSVTVVRQADILEIDKLFLSGDAVAEETELCQTLENEKLYAWKGTLKAGNFFVAIEFDEARAMSFTPSAAGTAITDGAPMNVAQSPTSAAESGKSWVIPADGEYRVVLDVDAKTLTIYSAATDFATPTVTYNNTTLGINPYTQDVVQIWMYGTFNGFDHDSSAFNGFQDKYSLLPSLANPNIFVYKGDVLPRKTQTLQYKLPDGTTSVAGAVVFFCGNFNNNMWAWGSTADAKRNDHSGIVTPTLGETSTVKAGQSDNRYAYFIIPENANFVVLDIKNNTIVFDAK